MNEEFIKRIIDRFDGKKYVALVIAHQEFDLPDSFWQAIVENNFGLAATILINKYSDYKANFIADALWES